MANLVTRLSQGREINPPTASDHFAEAGIGGAGALGFAALAALREIDHHGSDWRGYVAAAMAVLAAAVSIDSLRKGFNLRDAKPAEYVDYIHPMNQ
jgi:hypothetical protein